MVPFYLSLFLPSSPLFSQEKRNPFLLIRPTVQSHPRVPKREGQKNSASPKLISHIWFLRSRVYRNCVTLFFSDLYEGDESRSPIRPYWSHTFFCIGHPEAERKKCPGNNGARTKRLLLSRHKFLVLAQKKNARELICQYVG